MKLVLGAALLALILIAPVAAAEHWSLYYSGQDPSAGVTREPDSVVINADWSQFHGRANRVTLNGALPGDGGLFLDARFAQGVASAYVYTDGQTEQFFGRGDVLLPTDKVIAAWYGWWTDKDGDGQIDDVRARDCGSGCPTDEFIWRGAASDSSVNVRTVTLIGNHNKVLLSRASHEIELVDGTQSDDGWRGSRAEFVRDGSITTIHTLTVAGAQRTIGGDFAYDLDDPAGLIDVDRYQALNPEVESLYTSTLMSADTIRGVPNQVLAIALGVANQVTPEFNRLYAELGVAAVVSAVNGEVASAQRTAVDPNMIVYPNFPREPNQPDDDFNGYALYGGEGDLAGSYNSYAGYADAHHVHFDNVARIYNCVMLWAGVPSAPIAASQDIGCARSRSDAGTDTTQIDPVGAAVNGERASGTVMEFGGRHVLWKDLNLDGYLGRVCDPSGPTYDVERGTCEGRGYAKYLSGDGELIRICDAFRASMNGRGFEIEVTPVGADWPNVIIARDFNVPTRGIVQEGWEVRSDAEPITLRWESACLQDDSKSRDAIIFPTGASTIPLRVVASASIEGYQDVDKGITVAAEVVVDVDIIPALL